MPDKSDDYRLYLNERFDGLKTHIDDKMVGVNDRLDAIKEQTTRTNGRVTDLEDNFATLKSELDKHPTECSKSKEIDALKDDLIEYRFIKKYPKATAILVAIFVIGILISAYGTFSTMRSNFIDKETRQTIDTININTR